MKKCYIFGHEYVVNKGNNYGRYSTHICKYCGHTTGEPKASKWDYTFWQSDAWDTIKTWTIGLLIFTGVVFGIVYLFYWMNSTACTQYKSMGIDVMYNFWTGCMANHPKFGWIPVEKYFEVLNLYVK